jgi:hypothetical protein
MAMFVVLCDIEKHEVPRSPTGTELTKTLLLIASITVTS